MKTRTGSPIRMLECGRVSTVFTVLCAIAEFATLYAVVYATDNSKKLKSLP